MTTVQYGFNKPCHCLACTVTETVKSLHMHYFTSSSHWSWTSGDYYLMLQMRKLMNKPHIWQWYNQNLSYLSLTLSILSFATLHPSLLHVLLHYPPPRGSELRGALGTALVWLLSCLKDQILEWQHTHHRLLSQVPGSNEPISIFYIHSAYFLVTEGVLTPMFPLLEKLIQLNWT